MTFAFPSLNGRNRTHTHRSSIRRGDNHFRLVPLMICFRQSFLKETFTHVDALSANTLHFLPLQKFWRARVTMASRVENDGQRSPIINSLNRQINVNWPEISTVLSCHSCEWKQSNFDLVVSFVLLINKKIIRFQFDHQLSFTRFGPIVLICLSGSSCSCRLIFQEDNVNIAASASSHCRVDFTVCLRERRKRMMSLIVIIVGLMLIFSFSLRFWLDSFHLIIIRDVEISQVLSTIGSTDDKSIMESIGRSFCSFLSSPCLEIHRGIRLVISERCSIVSRHSTDQFVLYQPVQFLLVASAASFVRRRSDVLEGTIKCLFRAWLIVLVVLVRVMAIVFALFQSSEIDRVSVCVYANE